MSGGGDDHVHSLRVTGGVAEVKDDLATDTMRLYADQSAVFGRGFGLFANHVKPGVNSLGEFKGIIGIVKEEHRRDAIFIDVYMCRDSSGACERDHSSLVRTDKSTLSGSERHIESALCMIAVDQQRTSDPNWHLCGTNRV